VFLEAAFHSKAGERSVANLGLQFSNTRYCPLLRLDMLYTTKPT
jgi:hypothetical protein